MSNAAAIETAGAEAKALARQRRALEEAVQDANEKFMAQRAHVESLSGALLDPDNEEAEDQIAVSRQRLRELANELRAAESALAAFNESNPTP